METNVTFIFKTQHNSENKRDVATWLNLHGISPVRKHTPLYAATCRSFFWQNISFSVTTSPVTENICYS